MDEKLGKLKKGIKLKRTFIYAVSFLMMLYALMSVVNIVEYSIKKSESFQVKLVQDEAWKGAYCLFIDGENLKHVDYNDYIASVDENGNTNIKMHLIIKEIGTLVRYIFMGIIFYFTYLILDNISEPFSENNSKRLRIIGVLTILLAIIPGIIMSLVHMIYFRNEYIHPSQINFFVLVIGIFFGVISEIFKYGHELQNEIKS